MVVLEASQSIRDKIVAIAVKTVAPSRELQDFDADAPLVDLGFSSLDMANLMIAIEAEFDVMIPAPYLTPEHFRSVSTIAAMMAPIVSQT